MKLKIILIINILFISLCTTAQKNYIIQPSKHVIVDPIYNLLSVTDIYQENTSNQPIILKWKLISNNLQPGWDFSLCDYQTCYVGIPDSGVMDTVPPGEKGFLGLNVNPLEIKGTGEVIMFVYEDGHMDNGDTLVWEIAEPTGIKELRRSNILALYPNPANEQVTVRLSDYSNASVQVTDILGHIIRTTTVHNELTTINVADLPNGYYFIQCKYGNEIAGTKKLCISK